MTARAASSFLTILLGVLIGLTALGMDLFLPSVPAIAQAFDAEPGLAQLAVTTYLLGLAAGQFAWGPLADRFGRKVASAKEAREIMKIGVWYNSVDETLKNLGMPPNRGDDGRGFMVWETDGKKAVAHAMSDSHPMAYCMVPPESAKK